MTRFINALNKKRASLGSSDKGFTLIELLVVVIIIGILAAIAIPIYINVQNGAKDSAAQSDLANAKLAVVAYYTNNPSASTFPALTSLSDYGFSGTTVTATTVGTASVTNFCLKSSNGAQTFYITQNSAATTTKATNCS